MTTKPRYLKLGAVSTNEDMVVVLLMKEVLFADHSDVEHLLCGIASFSRVNLFLGDVICSVANIQKSNNSQYVNT